MAYFLRTLLVAAILVLIEAEDDFKDLEFNSDEVMIAQESRQYQSELKPPVRIIKPNGVTNSHRPQYNLDSLESDGVEFFVPTTKRTLVKNYKSSAKLRSDGMVRDDVLRILERKDQVGRFSQILPIIRAMSGPQRFALATLVANQGISQSGRNMVNLTQIIAIPLRLPDSRVQAWQDRNHYTHGAKPAIMTCFACHIPDQSVSLGGLLCDTARETFLVVSRQRTHVIQAFSLLQGVKKYFSMPA